MRQWLPILSLLCGAAPLWAGTIITLHPSAVPQGKYIRLAEIAEIRGDNAGNVEKVFLAPAPAADSSAVYNRADVLMRLRNLGLSQGVTLTGSEKVVVYHPNKAPARFVPADSAGGDNPAAAALPGGKKTERNSRKSPRAAGVKTAEIRRGINEARAIPAAVKRTAREETPEPRLEMAVREAVSRLLEKEFAGYEVRGRVDVRKLTLPVQNFAVLEASQITGGRLPGRIEVMLAARDGKGAVLDYGSADIMAAVEISTPVLTRSLNKGDALRDGDIALRYEPYNGQLPEKFTMNELRGRESLKALRAGSRVCVADFTAPQDLKKGGVLTVVTKGQGFKVSERAVALESGRVGDQIRVHSEYDSKRIYPVKITGSGTAEVVITH